MHPLMLQRLAANRVNEMITKPATDGRRIRCASAGHRSHRGKGQCCISRSEGAGGWFGGVVREFRC